MNAEAAFRFVHSLRATASSLVFLFAVPNVSIASAGTPNFKSISRFSSLCDGITPMLTARSSGWLRDQDLIGKTSSPQLRRYERPGCKPSAEDYNRVRATYGIRDDPKVCRATEHRLPQEPPTCHNSGQHEHSNQRTAQRPLISSFPCADIRHCLSNLGFRTIRGTLPTDAAREFVACERLRPNRH